MTEKRRRGRPKRDDIGVRLMRLPADLVDMVSWLARVEGTTAAKFAGR